MTTHAHARVIVVVSQPDATERAIKTLRALNWELRYVRLYDLRHSANYVALTRHLLKTGYVDCPVAVVCPGIVFNEEFADVSVDKVIRL